MNYNLNMGVSMLVESSYLYKARVLYYKYIIMCFIIMRLHVVDVREPFNFRTAGGVQFPRGFMRSYVCVIFFVQYYIMLKSVNSARCACVSCMRTHYMR